MLWAFYLALTVPALVGLVFNRHPSFESGLVYQSQLIINLLIRLPWVLLGLVWGVWVAQRVRTPSGAILGAVIGMFVVQVLYSIITTFLQAVTFFNYSYSADGSLNLISNNDLGLGIIGIAIALMIPVITWLLYITLPARVRRRI